MAKRQSFLLIAALLLFVLLASLSAGAKSQAAPLAVPRLHAQATGAATLEAAILPPDTKTLILDKPLIDTLDANTSNRLYKFDGKANQTLRLSIEPKTGNFFLTITILEDDLQTILGGTIGEALVGGDIIITLPDDGTYVVSVDYADSMVGTPAPGSFQVQLSTFKPN